ncbi:MAG TPA: hypothetical protein VHZ95_14855, partial [Polyangiales bacterium]|nr:hypothetical protein [Polyangiales bacterium]
MVSHRAGLFGVRVMGVIAALAFAAISLAGARAEAWVLQAPKGADYLTLPQNKVLCGPLPEGWESDPTRKRLRPSANADVGQALLVAIANEGACGGNVEEATLIVTGDHPSIDPNSVSIALDAGRLELSGDGLEGTRIGFAADGRSGSDVCLNVARDRDRDACALNIDRTLPADPARIALHWAPPGGRVGQDVVTFDKHGEPLAPDRTLLPVARLLISRMFPDTRMVDVTHGE